MSPFGFFGPKTGHRPLYAELCRYYQIDRKNRAILDAIVQKLNVQRPGELFLDVSWFQKGATHPDFSVNVDELRKLGQTLTQKPDKAIRFLAKSDNPAALELLMPLLDSPNETVRDLAFGSLYLKKTPMVYLTLFDQFLKNEEVWKKSAAVNPERLSKLAETAFNQSNPTYRTAASEMILKHKLYDALPTLLVYVEGPDPDVAKSTVTLVFQLCEAFYDELLNAPTATARRDLDRRREWLAQQLDPVVKRYSVHGFEEPLRALLIIAKKEYPTVNAVMQDHLSAACKKMVSMLAEAEHGSLFRFLFSYVGDPESPGLVDEILTAKSDPKFVGKLLETVGSAPTPEFKTALKRFKSFEWFKVGNPNLSTLVDGVEPAAVQLLISSGMSKDDIFRLLRFFLKQPSPESRRAAADALKFYVGEEINDMTMAFSNDPDPLVCVSLLRLMKSRCLKDADMTLLKMVERPELEIRQAIYELVPDLHADVFASKIGQMTQNTAKKLGRLVRMIDPNLPTLLNDELGSALPVRRMAACEVVRATGFGDKFENKIVDLALSDSDTNVRVAAINTMSQILTVHALETLKNLTKDRGMSIRNAAAEAVQTWAGLYQEAKQATH